MVLLGRKVAVKNARKEVDDHTENVCWRIQTAKLNISKVDENTQKIVVLGCHYRGHNCNKQETQEHVVGGHLGFLKIDKNHSFKVKKKTKSCNLA